MKTLEHVLTEYKQKTTDGCDLTRLACLVPDNKLPRIGLEVVPRRSPRIVKPWTRESVLKELKADVAFGFDEALTRRGVEARAVFEVVRMWNWILGEGLEAFTAYAKYGLPLYKATAVKYGWPNPIGGNSGSEREYNA